MAHTIEGCNFTLHTPLEEHLFQVLSFTGTERLSQEYQYNLQVASSMQDLSHEDLLYEMVSLEIERPGESSVWISGRVASFEQCSHGEDLSRYDMTLVSWTWFLQQRENCRIFQNQTTLEIVKSLFDGAGFSGAFVDEVQGTLSPREFCVQYNESDLQFMRRLLEEEGIFTYFRMKKKESVLVLADNLQRVATLDEGAPLHYILSAEERTREDGVISFAVKKSVSSSIVTLREYDFQKSSTLLEVVKNQGKGREVYRYPGGFAERSQGERRAQIRLEAIRAEHQHYSGVTSSRRVICGATFSLENHPREAYNVSYLLTEVRREGSQMDEETTCMTYFVALPTTTPFRPSYRTPRPVISGIQTAKVVGPAGEEIWLDSYGRVKLQFPWDRESDGTDSSSCWVRVAQSMAGSKWGSQCNPRVGQEVIVQFLEGNPDRPVVTGALYNSDHLPPNELPAQGSQTILKTRSTPRGGVDNANEFRFEDKKGEEHILLHAEKDLLLEVEHDELHTVGNNRTITVEVDELHTVKNNRSSVIEVDESLFVKGNRNHTVEGDEKVLLKGSRQETIESDVTQIVQGNHTVKVSGDSVLTIDRSVTTEVGSEMTISAGTTLTIEAGTELVLKCGEATITLGSSGTVEIMGLEVSVAGTKATLVESSAQTVISAPLVKIN